MKRKLFTFTVLTFCLAITPETPAALAASLTVVADGISNARGAAFGSDGTLYVGEAGIGGNGNCLPTPTLFEPICAGNTGSVVKITPDGQQERIFNNFQSLAPQPGGIPAFGLQELQFDSQGNAYLLTGFVGYPGYRDSELNALAPLSRLDPVLNTLLLGQLFKADLNTEELTSIFDFVRYEITNNPDGSDVHSNPSQLTISGDTAYVVDTGGNTVYKIKLDGSDVKAIPLPPKIISNLEFPPFLLGLPTSGLVDVLPPDAEGLAPRIVIQSVPTGVAIGSDGALYVGESLGFPNPEGEARIFRIGDDNVPEVYADGFTHITDLTFDKYGNLLVLQFSDRAQWKGDIQNPLSSLIQLASDGTRTTLVAAGEGLLSAYGITIGPDDQIYITTQVVGSQLGQIVRVDRSTSAAKVPEPTSIIALLTVTVGIFAMLKRKRQEELTSVGQNYSEGRKCDRSPRLHNLTSFLLINT